MLGKFFVLFLALFSLASCQADLFNLIPGRYPDCVSLPTILSQIPDSSSGRAFVRSMAEFFWERFGIKIPSYVLDMVFQDSPLLLDYLVLSPLEMALGAEAVQLAYLAGLLNESTTPPPHIPSGIALENIASYPLDPTPYLPPTTPTEIIPGLLYQSFVRSSTPVATIKSEIVLALIFDQLANNTHLSAHEQFTLTYRGRPYTSVDGVLSALLASGHEISVWLTWRSVDFFGYRALVNGTMFDLPVPVLVDTGLGGAIIPAIHNEFVIQITGPDFSGKLLWYEGDDGIGFFAGDIYGLSPWVGTQNSAPVYNATAVSYVRLMAVFGDVLLQASDTFNLYDYGYGSTGVCVDSTCVVENAQFGTMSLYPLLMDKSYAISQLKANIKKGGNATETYLALLQSVDVLVPDYLQAPHQAQRALTSIANAPGKEAFQCTVDARKILASLL